MSQNSFDKYELLINQLLDCPDLKATLEILNQLPYLNNLKTTEEIFKENCFLIDEGLISAMEEKAEKLIEEGKKEAAGWLRNLAEQLGEKINSWDALNQKVQEVYSQNKLPEAIEVARQSLDLAKSIWQSEHPNVASCIGNLAYLFMAQSQYREAESLFSDALAIYQRLFSKDNPNAAACLYNLGQLSMHQMKYSEAESLFRNALAMNQRLFKDDHPDVANYIDGLAVFLDFKGKYAEAELLSRQALVMRQKLFKGDHPAVVASLHNLAKVLMHEGKITEAESLFRDSLAMNQRLFKGDHPGTAATLGNLTQLLQKQGKYIKAEPLCRKALAMQYRLFKGDHLNIATSLGILAQLLMSQAKHNQAEPLLRSALAMTQRLFPEDDPNVVATLCSLAEFLEHIGKDAEAESLFRDALVMNQRLFPEDHSGVATCLDNLAQLLREQGKYVEAESFYRDALAMRRKLFKDDHQAVANSLNNLAELLKDREKYYEAEPLASDALTMYQRLFREDHSGVAACLDNLGSLFMKQGKYAEAETLIRDALKMRCRLFKVDHPEVATSFNNLGLLFMKQGKYAEAEDLLHDAVKIGYRLYKGDHPSLATSLCSLAQSLTKQGKYTAAEVLFRDVLAMRQRLFKGDHLHVSTSLNNLGLLLHNQGLLLRNREKYAEAEVLYRDALAMKQRLFNDDNPDVAVSLNNLAELLKDQGKYSEAESFCREALEIYRGLFPEDNPNVATCLNNLGLILHNQKKYSEAEVLYRDALAMIRRLFNDDNPDVAVSLSNLGLLLKEQGKYREALAKCQEAAKVENKITNRVFALSSELGRIHHLNQVRITTDFFLSLIFNYLQDDIETIHDAFDFVLQRESLSVGATEAFNAVIYEERYVHLQAQFLQLRSLGEKIRYLSFKSTYENRERLEQLKQERERLEKYLAFQVPEIQLKGREINYQMLAEQLPEGSILIKLIGFCNCDFQNNQWGSIYYLAFILPAQQPDKVIMKVLGEATKIEELIETTRRQVILSTAKGNLGVRWGQTPDNYEHSYSSPAAIQLRQIIFDPLQEYLENSQQLFIVPDGKLSLIPFQLLPLDEQGEELLIDRYRISYLSAARDLFRSNVETQRPASPPLVIADPKFDLDLATVSSLASTNSGATLNISLLREEFEKQTESVKLNRAEATGIVGKKVASLLNVQPHLQEDAVATHLKNNQCPSILFIGTHGLYLEQKREKLTEPGEPISLNPMNPYRAINQTENPMLRSALTFAGAETWLKGENLPPEVGTGLLFAQEVAELDLWANEITVLLACNSAVGDVSIGEGVFGLRRAFAVAGAKTLIMSLWSVPENASALLMERFFNNLQQSRMERDKALQEAQNYIRNLTIPELLQSELGLEVMKELTGDSSLTVENASRFDETQKPLSHPFYWAAWICQGETTPLPSLLTLSIESLKEEIAGLSAERQNTLKTYPILTNPKSLSNKQGWISQLKPMLQKRNIALIFYAQEPNQQLIVHYQELVKKVPHLYIAWITSTALPLPFKGFSPKQHNLVNSIKNWLNELG